ncbi:MAG: VWA domain-containing protein [Acidobacteria bacterium]|nr:VWA domain-containing protein [Acidobacteriota bacterium]
MSVRVVLAAVALLCAATTGPWAQTQSPPGQPIFRSGVDLITIDVVVVDGDGEQMPALTADDFAVEVDGQPRAVLSAQYFEGAPPLVPGSRDAAAAARAAAVPADPNANQIILAIDVGSTSPASRDQVLAAANAVLDRLPPADRVATVALPLRMAEFTFTTNRQVSRQALQGITGWSPRLGTQLPFGIVEAQGMDRGEREWEAAVSRVCNRGDEFVRLACRADLEAQARVLVSEASARAATTTTSLEVLLRSLARIEGPKTMLFFSEELPTDGARVEVERVARAAAAARTRIHVMHALPGTQDVSNMYLRYEPVKERQRALEGLELVSDWTGGDLFALGTSDEIASRLARELSGRYLLMVETMPGDRDGRPHRIRVQTPRHRVTVRARREFVADNLRTSSPLPVTPDPEDRAGPPGGAREASPANAVAATAASSPESGIPAATARGSVFVSVDPLHPDRKSAETIQILNTLRAALSARGYSSAPSAAAATVRVEVTGQRVLGEGRTALPTQSRGGSSPTALIRVTVSDGTRISELRGRNQGDLDITRSAADETARLIERWVGGGGEGAAAPSAPPPAPPPSTVPPQELLPRVRAYVGEYEKALAGIVAEERYVQTYSQRTAAYPAPPRLTRRELRSEMGFAWFPTPGTWFGFRDVYEANGRPVTDRQQRLEQLFVDRRFPSDEQLARVAESSARFNIGPARRNFNVPTLALLVASPANVGRFSFELRGYDAIDGVRVALIAFSETGSPTLITRDGHDWPSRGLLWVEPESGRIWRTDIQLTDRDIEMRQTTWFTLDGRLELMVPARMRELYDYVERADEYVEAVADYSNVRRFRVETSGHR